MTLHILLFYGLTFCLLWHTYIHTYIHTHTHTQIYTPRGHGNVIRCPELWFWGSHMYVAEILLLACLVNNTESGTKDMSVDV